jgi:ElaB/YqjD/DUF883 family membrane-anchored ribosome-binding protein
MAAGGIPSGRELIRALREQNWRVEQTGQGHYKGFAPDGHTLVTFCDTTEPRAMKNNLAELRRSGQFQWPPPDKHDRRGPDVVSVLAEPRVPVPTAPVASRQPATSLDALFRNLKDAKAELTAMETKHNAVMDVVRQAEEALEEAKRRAERALAEAREQARRSQDDLDAARRLVMEAKAEFDSAFEGNAA